MRKWVILLLLSLLVICFSGLAYANPETVLIQTNIEYEKLPLKGPVELGLRVPSDTKAIRLVYEQLGFDDGIHVLSVSAFEREVRVVIPTEHTTEPGIRYWWEVDTPSGTHKTDETIISFIIPIYDSSYEIEAIGDWVAHDIERNGGKLPNGTIVSSGQGRLPHGLTPSSAWVSSKTLEVRNIAGSYIHLGLDFAMAGGNIVKAMEAGVVHRSAWDSVAGHYIILRHAGTEYYTFYFHLNQRLVEEKETVTKGQDIGYSGNTGSGAGGYHLCTGYRVYVNGQAKVLYPFRYFMGNFGGYPAHGFDYIQKPQSVYDPVNNWTYTDVIVHSSYSQYTPWVRIVWRQKGTTTWYESPMLRISGTNTWRHYWDIWYHGKTMEYYIKAGRSDASSSHWATRPAKYHSANPGLYYECTVKGGPIMKLKDQSE